MRWRSDRRRIDDFCVVRIGLDKAFAAFARSEEVAQRILADRGHEPNTIDINGEPHGGGIKTIDGFSHSFCLRRHTHHAPNAPHARTHSLGFCTRNLQQKGTVFTVGAVLPDCSHTRSNPSDQQGARKRTEQLRDGVFSSAERVPGARDAVLEVMHAEVGGQDDSRVAPGFGRRHQMRARRAGAPGLVQRKAKSRTTSTTARRPLWERRNAIRWCACAPRTSSGT